MKPRSLARLRRRPLADDVVLVNERGAVTETCTANLAVSLIGQLKADPDSYLNESGEEWTFAEGIKLQDGPEVATIRDFLEFAGVLI